MSSRERSWCCNAVVYRAIPPAAITAGVMSSATRT